MLDLIFRLFIAGAAVTGCYVYFTKRDTWVKQCHLIMGVLAVVFCAITFFAK